jgi:hypothetical protein
VKEDLKDKRRYSMKNIMSLLALALISGCTAAIADTSMESRTVSGPEGGTSSSTTILQNKTDAPAIVAPAPSVSTTKFKENRHGFFHHSKVKGETTTVTP